MQYFLLGVNVLIMTAGQLFFKGSADFINSHPNLRFPMSYVMNPWFYIAVSLYVVSTFVWIQVLTRMSLSIAYPIVSAAYILTLIGAAIFFHEHISTISILGVLLIMSGISLIALH